MRWSKNVEESQFDPSDPNPWAALYLDTGLPFNKKAKASILKELYHDYNLNSLLDEYPETRVRFFMMTCFKESGEKLNLHFQSIIQDMRSKILSPWNLKERIKEIMLVTV